jgi:ComF family protein
MYDLPRLRFRDHSNNAVARLFWGRVWLEYATSCFHFQRGSRYQGLIHGLKYGGRTDIGVELGGIMGQELKNSPMAQTDLILPVPLHPRKLRRRGYNQCDYIAEGLSHTLKIHWNKDILSRISSSSSQTSKSRSERWDHLDNAFRVEDPGMIQGKHILLIDDVVTTGSTLEACAGAILQSDSTRVSIATLAYTGRLF